MHTLKKRQLLIDKLSIGGGSGSGTPVTVSDQKHEEFIPSIKPGEFFHFI